MQHGVVTFHLVVLLLERSMVKTQGAEVPQPKPEAAGMGSLGLGSIGGYSVPTGGTPWSVTHHAGAPPPPPASELLPISRGY